MIDGQVLGNGTAHNPAGGASVPFQLIKATKSLRTFKDLGGASKRWRDAAGRLAQHHGDVGRRAQFADEVLAQLIVHVQQGLCCVLVAQASDGRVLGVSYYLVDPRKKEAYLALQAIDPEHVPGTPGTSQLRGVGTALTAAASRDFLAQGVETVYLHPLDAAADRFWRGRGFQTCGVGGRLCVHGRQAIEALRGTCELRREGDDECLVCGQGHMTAAVRLPVRA